MTRLNQIIAVQKGVKAQHDQAITAAYHGIQKPELFSGISRTYTPKDDEGERLPAESIKVMLRADELLGAISTVWTRRLNAAATMDWANTQACADVTIDGEVIAAKVPVTYLMWLEKQLVDLSTFISKLPTLDPAQQWALNTEGVWATPVVQTTKSAKVPFNWVRAEATKEHAAQVEVLHKDVLVGTWDTIRTSGALPLTRKTELIRRVQALSQAVKFAREEANLLEVTDQEVGGPLFDFLLAE